MIEQLERGDVSAVWDLLHERVQAKVSADQLGGWGSALDGWIGSPRTLDDDLVLTGPQGRLRVGVQVDNDRVERITLTPVVDDGIRNIVIGTPRGEWNDEAQRAEGAPRLLGEFYAELLGATIIRDDWIKVGRDNATFPHLAFGDGWSDERRPDDPSYPTQVHLDFFVPDVEIAGRRAADRGARHVRDNVYTDPFGHPFCLETKDATALARVVFDCSDPEPSARFYSELLEMTERVEESPERIVIRRDGRLPMLAFRRVAGYVAPRWHDPAYPHQMHVDLQFNDPAAARAKAERLGAVALPPPRGSCAVYADPAGHPFCLCSSAGTEEPYVVDVFAN